MRACVRACVCSSVCQLATQFRLIVSGIHAGILAWGAEMKF